LQDSVQEAEQRNASIVGLIAGSGEITTFLAQLSAEAQRTGVALDGYEPVVTQAPPADPKAAKTKSAKDKTPPPPADPLLAPGLQKTSLLLTARGTGLQLLAIERRGGGAPLIEANAERLGVRPAAVLEGDALALLQGGETAADALPKSLQRPDRVLLGGGGRARAALLERVLQRLQPGGVVVIPLATLEALAELRPLLETAGCQVNLSQLQSWRGQALVGGTRLAPMNPVLVLKGRLPGP